MRLVCFALFASLFVASATAQTSVGAQLGDPTGLSLKVGAGSGALLLAVGWDFTGDDAINVEGHYLLRERGLQGNRQIRFFYGPGLFASFGDTEEDRFGVSVGVGLETELVPALELYGLISPRLQLIQETNFDAGGGIGIRLQI